MGKHIEADITVSMATLNGEFLKRQSAARLCKIADELASKGDHIAALRVLNFAAGKYPDNPRVCQLKGYSLLSLRHFGAALSSFRKCLALVPQRTHYHFYSGKVYAAMKKYHLAINEYRKAMNSRWPYSSKTFTNAVIYRQMAFTYISWRKPGEALWAYEQEEVKEIFGAPLRKRIEVLKRKHIRPKTPAWACDNI